MNQKELANLIGVSSATISRVINNDESVSESTRQKVREGIKKHGYVQNIAARNLRTSNNHTIGFIAPDINNPFFTESLAGIESLSYEKNYAILVQNTSEDIKKEKIALESLLSHRIAGLIAVCVDTDTPYIDRFKNMGMPVVMMERRPANSLKNDVVLVDNIEGVKKAVKYLAMLGHKDIAYIYGRVHGEVQISSGIQRMEGFEQGMREAGLPIRKEYLVDGYFTSEGSYKATIELIQLDKKPSAIITCSNLSTIGAYQALFDNRIKIPDDISLVGFDDFTLAGYLTPPVTVIKRPTAEAGRVAAEILFEYIEKRRDMNAKPREIVLPTELLVRKSCCERRGD